MARLRSQDGFLSYIGIFAALIIVMMLTLTSFKQFGLSGGGGGPGGASTDGGAQTEALHALPALQTCARSQGGSFDGCGVEQVTENEPTLTPARGRMTVVAAGTTAQIGVKSSTGNTFTVAVNGNSVARTCTVAGRGSCPASGRW